MSKCLLRVKLHLYKLGGELGLVHMGSTVTVHKRLINFRQMWEYLKNVFHFVITSIQKVPCFKCKASYFDLILLFWASSSSGKVQMWIIVFLKTWIFKCWGLGVFFVCWFSSCFLCCLCFCFCVFVLVVVVVGCGFCFVLFSKTVFFQFGQIFL